MSDGPIWHAGDVDLSAIADANRESLAGHIGIEFIGFGDDWLEARMPVDRRTVQPFGRLHGGASVALAETVASVAGMLTLDPTRKVAVGMEINANHVRPASGGFVHAVARPDALQRTSQIWSVRITDEAGRLISISRVTLAVIPASLGAPASA